MPKNNNKIDALFYDKIKDKKYDPWAKFYKQLLPIYHKNDAVQKKFVRDFLKSKGKLKTFEYKFTKPYKSVIQQNGKRFVEDYKVTLVVSATINDNGTFDISLQYFPEEGFGRTDEMLQREKTFSRKNISPYIAGLEFYSLLSK